jgi:hypothetical protein
VKIFDFETICSKIVIILDKNPLWCSMACCKAIFFVTETWEANEQYNKQVIARQWTDFLKLNTLTS